VAYHILSLDGGGSWALIEIKALIKVYGPEIRGNEVLSQFDLVAANSGGSIVLGCLVENKTLAECLSFFKDQKQREAVFSATRSIFLRLLKRSGLTPKYDASQKLAALEAALPRTGKSRLNGITAQIRSQRSGEPVHLLITSFDFDSDRAAFFRSAHVSRAGWGTGAAASVTVAEAIHASTNAPVKYFDAPAAFPTGTKRYWDGAVSGCNNPVMAAVTEAVGKGVDPKQVIALSIGTANVVLPRRGPHDPPSPFFATPSKVSLLGGIEKIAESVLDDPPDVASFLAHVMTGSGTGVESEFPDGKTIDSRVVRMNPLISPVKKQDGQWHLPGDLSQTQFDFLAGLDLDAIQEHEVDAIERYAELWLRDEAPNQPVRLDGATLKTEIGQGLFTEAFAAWKALNKES